MNIPLMYCLNISPDSWIQLFSGFGAVVVALLAIIHGNKNSRKHCSSKIGLFSTSIIKGGLMSKWVFAG